VTADSPRKRGNPSRWRALRSSPTIHRKMIELRPHLRKANPTSSRVELGCPPNDKRALACAATRGGGGGRANRRPPPEHGTRRRSGPGVSSTARRIIEDHSAFFSMPGDAEREPRSRRVGRRLPRPRLREPTPTSSQRQSTCGDGASTCSVLGNTPHGASPTPILIKREVRVFCPPPRGRVRTMFDWLTTIEG